MTEAKKTETDVKKAGKPIVADYEYTSGLKNFQESEKSYSEAIQKLSNAVKEGVDTYLEARDKSASEKKDGAIEDWFVNSAKGVSSAVEAGSGVIYDLAKSADSYLVTDRQRKDIKRYAKSFSKFRLPIVPIPFVFGYGDDDEDEDDD